MLVALPSAIAFGVLTFTAVGPSYAGVGASAGALGAAVLGLVAPLVGRNGGFVTAPCAPAAAVLSGFAIHAVRSDASDPERVLGLMIVAALLAAGMQIGFGALKLGRFMKFIPYQVVTGYLSGVAVIIAVGQVPKWLGFGPGVGFFHGLSQPSAWQWPGIVVGAITIVITFVAPRITRVVPEVILGLLAGVASYFLIAIAVPELLSTSDNVLVVGPIAANGSLLQDLTRGVSVLGTTRLADLELVLATSATLAVLLSIDTLKTGVVLDALTRTRNDSNRELIAQGVANACSAITGAMPGAGTMGPTLVNITSGGRSPRSGFLAGVFALLVFALLRTLLAWIPLGALAGILMVVAWKMFDWKLFRLLLRRGTRLDFFVITAVILAAVGIGLIQASVVGIILAILIFIRDQARSSVIRDKRDLRQVSSTTSRPAEHRDVLQRTGNKGLLVELQDNLFFGTTDQLFSDLADDLQTRRFILLDFRRLQSMDYTAGHLLKRMEDQLEEHDGKLLLAGMPSTLPTGDSLEKYLTDLGVLGRKRGVRVFETRNAALEWMEDCLLEAAGFPPRSDETVLGIRELELFRELDDQALEAIESASSTRIVQAGERVFSRGDSGDELFLVLKGAVDISLPLGEGIRHHLVTIARGDYLGEVAFLDRGHRSADATARTETHLLALSRTRFNAIARANPVVATMVFARLATLLSKRLRTVNAELRALERR